MYWAYYGSLQQSCWLSFPFPDGQIKKASSTCKHSSRPHSCITSAILHRRLLQCRYLRVVSLSWCTYTLIRTQCTFLILFTFQYSSTSSIFPYTPIFLDWHFTSVSYKTLKLYLSGIHLVHIDHRLPDPTDDKLLQLICHGICINKRISRNQGYPSPLTI